MKTFSLLCLTLLMCSCTLKTENPPIVKLGGCFANRESNTFARVTGIGLNKTVFYEFYDTFEIEYGEKVRNEEDFTSHYYSVDTPCTVVSYGKSMSYLRQKIESLQTRVETLEFRTEKMK